jgi:hypothetical protein
VTHLGVVLVKNGGVESAGRANGLARVAALDDVRLAAVGRRVGREAEDLADGEVGAGVVDGVVSERELEGRDLLRFGCMQRRKTTVSAGWN